MVSRDATTICEYTYSTGGERKNFFDLAQILGPLPNAWPGGVRHALWTEVVRKILINRISQHQAVDGKPEIYGGAYENQVSARLKTGAT